MYTYTYIYVSERANNRHFKTAATEVIFINTLFFIIINKKL